MTASLLYPLFKFSTGPRCDRIRGPRRLPMADKDVVIGRVINITGMIGVLAGTVLFTFAIVLILFRRGFGLDIPYSIYWFWLMDHHAESVLTRHPGHCWIVLRLVEALGDPTWNRF